MILTTKENSWNLSRSTRYWYWWWWWLWWWQRVQRWQQLRRMSWNLFRSSGDWNRAELGEVWSWCRGRGNQFKIRILLRGAIKKENNAKVGILSQTACKFANLSHVWPYWSFKKIGLGIGVPTNFRLLGQNSNFLDDQDENDDQAENIEFSRSPVWFMLNPWLLSDGTR